MRRFLSWKVVDFALFQLQLRAPALFGVLRQLWWRMRYQLPAPSALQGNCADYSRYRISIARQLKVAGPKPDCLQAAGRAGPAIWQASGQRICVFKHPQVQMRGDDEALLIRALARQTQHDLVYADYEFLQDDAQQLVPMVASDPLAWRHGAPIPVAFAIKAEIAQDLGLQQALSAQQWQQQWQNLLEETQQLTLQHLALPLAQMPPGQSAPTLVSPAATPMSQDTSPSISIVVPTRDGGATLDAGIRSVLATLESMVIDWQLCIVDNGSKDPQTLKFLADIEQVPHGRIRVLKYDKPFNYSAINNWAVEQCSGEALLLLNDDVQALDRVWLEQMLNQLAAGAGAVGARLCYPDGRIQHDGVALGLGGVAEHPGKGLWPDDPRLARWARAPNRYVSAVTGACLLTRTALYRELGGLNATDLQVAFNDIDYCLRLTQAGHAIVQCSDAVLIHHESLSRGKEDSWHKHRRFDREIAFMQKRWGSQLASDPFYSPHLSRHASDLSFRLPPCAELADYGLAAGSSPSQ